MYGLLLNWPGCTLISCIQRITPWYHFKWLHVIRSWDSSAGTLPHFVKPQAESCAQWRNLKNSWESMKSREVWSNTRGPRPRDFANMTSPKMKTRLVRGYETRLIFTSLISPIYNVEWTVLCRYATVVRYVASMYHWQLFYMWHSDSCE